MKKTFTAVNDSSEQRQKSNILFALCFLAYTFSYFGRYNYSTCVDSMTEAGLLDKSFGGIISAAYLIFYGAGQFINGRLGVRVSPKLIRTPFGGLIRNFLQNSSYSFEYASY